MIKHMLEFVDIDGERQTRTVMFNLTRFELDAEIELEVLQERFQKFQDEVIGDDPNAPVREMTGPEKREMLSMIKQIVRHSYGRKDGKRFIKSQEVWDEFEQTGAFSAYMYWLFEDPSRANSFMAGIWPQGVDRPNDPDNPQPSPELSVVKGEVEDSQDVPDDSYEVKENLWDYSREQLLGMPDPEFEAVTRKFKEGNNVPRPLLQIAAQRDARKRVEDGGE